MHFIINSIINFFLDILNKYKVLCYDRNQLNFVLTFFQRREEAPKPKRKKEFIEIIGKLKANDNDISKAGGD